MYKFKIAFLSAIGAFMLFSFTSAPEILHSNKPDARFEMTNTPNVVWAKDIHDFGETPQGKPVSVTFTFTNTGDAAFLISDVKTSCGCTASDYPKEPIEPGKSSTIKVTYNAHAIGTFSKTITVMSNDHETAKVLTIKGTVK